MELSTIGKPVPNFYAQSHATGQTQYVDDVSFPGMLWAKAFRSPVPRGRIKRIDYQKALNVPGVVSVLTSKDVPNNLTVDLFMIGVGPPDEPVLAEEYVNYIGEPICLVVAKDQYAAQKGAERIEADIEELEPLLDPEEALRPGAPIIKSWGHNAFIYGSGTDGATPPGGQGRPYFQVKRGDVERAFQSADHVIKGEYVMHPQEHAPIETHVCVAKPEPDGRLTIYSSSQAPYFVRSNVANVLKMQESKIRVISLNVGGGFGGKVDPDIEQLTALAALKTNRPVKWRWTREEEFTVSTVRAGTKVYLEDAVSRDGLILGRKGRLIHDAGAYSKTSPYGVIKATVNLSGPYRIPSAYYQGYCVYTNKQPSSAMRGYGAYESTFAVELHMERIAKSIGIDSWEFRFKNAYRRGDVSVTGKVMEDAYLIEVMKEAARLANLRLPEHLLLMSSER